MKIIITERQRKLISEDEDRGFLVKKKIAKKQLTKKFGDLTPIKVKDYPHLTFYGDEKRKIYIQYYEHYKKIGIDEIYSFLEDIFDFDDDQINKIIKEWLGDHYGLEVEKVIQADRDFWGWDEITNR